MFTIFRAFYVTGRTRTVDTELIGSFSRKSIKKIQCFGSGKILDLNPDWKSLENQTLRQIFLKVGSGSFFI